MYNPQFSEDYIQARQQELEARAKHERLARTVLRNARANRKLKPTIIALIATLTHK